MKKSISHLPVFLWLIFSSCGDGNSSASGNFKSTADNNGNSDNEIGFKYNSNNVSTYIDQWMDSAEVKVELPQISISKFATELFKFYSARDFQPAWKLNTAQELVEILSNIDNEGLNPASYPIGELKANIDKAKNDDNPEDAAKLDLLLSGSYLKLADMIATGKVKPGELSSSWHIKPQSPDTLYTHLQQAIEGDMDASLNYFRPRFDQYDKLQEHLDKYKKIINNGGWSEVPYGEVLKPGDSTERIRMVRQRLHITGDLESGPSEWKSPYLYDYDLKDAVNRFQERHGLEVQPAITDAMVAAMNASAEMRLKQIKLNLDRIRWFSSGEMPGTYVLVNIPEYTLMVFEDGKEIKRMKVVVGEVMNTTPIFSDVIEYAIFSPYWNVPSSISEEEIWPAARNNPGYFQRNHYEVLDGWNENARVVPYEEIDWANLDQYRIRQKPGPWNALGRVKFMFPNDFAIYLHDTPADQLFDKQHRAFSHGCIRMEEPDWFADWLFPQYDRQDVIRKMNDQQRDVVGLKNNVPVFIFYLTTFVDEDGRINFRKDLYKLDERLTGAFDAV